MCIIAYTRNRAMNKNEFDECWTSNPDGLGLAYQCDGKVHVVKGLMKKEQAWGEYKKAKKETKTGIVLHFRIRTAGDICEELTHPFLVHKDSPTDTRYSTSSNILFHNGCLLNWKDDLLSYLLSGNKASGHMSDSRWLAMKISRMNLDEQIESLKKESGKFVLMTKDEVFLVGNFEESNGIFYSNSTYKRYTSTSYWNGRYWNDSEFWSPSKKHLPVVSVADKEAERKPKFKKDDYVTLSYTTPLQHSYGFRVGDIVRIKNVQLTGGVNDNRIWYTVTDGIETAPVEESYLTDHEIHDKEKDPFYYE